MKFSILHATARPHLWKKSHDAWLTEASGDHEIEYILCVDKRWGFPDGYDAGPGIIVEYSDDGPRGTVYAWNKAAAASTGDVLILNADDFFPQQNWDIAIRDAIGDCSREAVVRVSTGGVNDDGGMLTLGILTRARYEGLGYVLYPKYESVVSDIDFTEHAERDGVVVNARHIMIAHRHGSTHSDIGWDDVYESVNRRAAYDLGEDVLAERRANDFKL